MKILFDLQLSFIDKLTNKFKVDNDSNYNFTKNAILGLYELDSTIEFGLVLPPISDIEDTRFFDGSNFLGANINFYFAHYEKDFIRSRFDFPYNEIKSVIDKFKPDIIWTNDFCRVASYKLLQRNQRFKIVAYNHWIDNFIYPKVPSEHTYLFRQVEGAYQADYAVFNTNMGISLFMDGVHDIFTDKLSSIIAPKCKIVKPAFNFNYLENVKDYKQDIITVLFNHRLSPLPYYSSNFEQFKCVCNELIKSYNFNVILTNPSGYKMENIPSYMQVCNMPNYFEYLQFISSCHFAVGLFFDSPGTWSMSLAEAAACGLPLVLPNKPGYYDIVPRNYKYLCSNTDEATSMMKKLLEMPEKERKMIGAQLQSYAKLTYSLRASIEEFYIYLTNMISR